MTTWTDTTKNTTNWSNQSKSTEISVLLLENLFELLLEDNFNLLLETITTTSYSNQTKNSTSYSNQTKN